MDPLVTGGIHLAREAFKWLSKQDWNSGSQQPNSSPQIPTFLNTPVLKFNTYFEIDADASGIYAIHPIHLIQSEVNKLKRAHGALSHISVLLAECDESRSGSYLELVPNTNFFFEITLEDLIEGEEQGQNLIFLRDKISRPPRRCTASVIFNTETESIIGLSYLNRSVIYGDKLHILEKVSALADRYYPYQATSIVNQRACHEYGAADLEKRYSLTPWNFRDVAHTTEELITLRSLYSLDRSGIRHFKSLVKNGLEHIDTLKDLLGYGEFEGYADGLLRLNFQMCYAPRCTVIGTLETTGWPKQLQREAAHLFAPIKYSHAQSNHHETDPIFFQIDGSNPMYPLVDQPIIFTVRYDAWSAPKYQWRVALSEEIHNQMLLDQIIIQVLQILDRLVGVNLNSTDGEFVVKRALSILYGEDYIQYSAALLKNYNKVQGQPEVYSERSIVWALMINTLINPFSLLTGGVVAVDELAILKSMSDDDFAHKQIDFLIAAQCMTDQESIGSHYLEAYKMFLDSEMYEVVFDQGREVLRFEYKSLLKTSYIGISSRELSVYAKSGALKYTFDMSVDHAKYEKDGDRFKLILNNGKKKKLWIDSALLSLIRNLICINRGGAPLDNSNLNVPNYQKEQSQPFSLLSSLVGNDELTEGMRVLRREFDDFSSAKALALLIGGGLGAFFNISQSDTNKIILQTYKVFRDLSDSDKEKVRRMLSVTNSISNLQDLMHRGSELLRSER